MKLLYVTDMLAIHGGLERVLVDKVNWIAQQGEHEVFLITACQGNHMLVFPLHPNVNHVDLGVLFLQQYHYRGLKRWLLNFKLHRQYQQRLQSQIKEISPDVVICPRKDLVVDVEKVRGNIPMVYESHSSRLAGTFEGWGLGLKLLTRYYESYIRKVQMLVSLTEGDAIEWRKLLPCVEVIPNIVHLNENGRKSNCLSKSVVFVGRYSRQKDISTLIRVWELVHQQYPDWRLDIYGGYGEQKNHLHTKILQMNANIVEHEPTSNIFDAYLSSSLLLLTSIYEPFGLVIPEAMSCGLPVVAFDCPYGPSDLITEGVDGYLIKKGNISDFVAKVCLLLNDQELRCKMGESAILSSQRYSAKRIMPKWMTLFNSLINKGS